MSSLKAILFSLSFAIFPLIASDDTVSDQEQEQEQTLQALQGCSFRVDPGDLLNAKSRVRDQVFESVRKLGVRRAFSAEAEEPATRRNFIDDEIFSKLDMMKVPAARRSSDEEFIRRVYLDLTGRIPSAGEVRDFIGSGSNEKRDELIEKLVYSPEFSRRWSVWFSDLIQNTERLSTNARAPQIEGRNALDIYIRDRFNNNRPISGIVTELITATGINYLAENGQANYPVLASTAMGPVQDTYDMMLSRTATAFLGMSHYDCLLCHSGPRHLTGISVWGDNTTRSDAQRMAAFFSRMRLNNGAPGSRQYEHALYNSTDVQDAATGQYDLNTTAGNRPPRAQVGTQRNFTPEYRDGSRPGPGENWRVFFASKLLEDPMFHRNMVNRVWKHFFGLGLVDPVDTLDPARLDPNNPPPAPWTLQATHPALLEKLAAFFRQNNTDLRALARLIVRSSAYQLSSTYEDTWRLEYVPLFARHYPRRLDAEEIVDALVTTSSVMTRYTWPVQNGQTVPRGSALKQSDPVTWAMELPDINEPRNNGTIRDLMRTFYRGNRDTAPRMQAGSILQQLALMNSTFVLDRIRLTGNSPSPVLAAISRMPDANGQSIDELFLTFLSRRPTPAEKSKAQTYLQRAVSRTEAFQDLAWACINKVDFLFSY